MSLNRALELFTELHHPFVRSRAFSHLIPPAGATAGTVFTLPDGREVLFSVAIRQEGNAFAVDATAAVEEKNLLTLPRRSAPDIHSALNLLESYLAEVVDSSRRLVDDLLDEVAGQ